MSTSLMSNPLADYAIRCGQWLLVNMSGMPVVTIKINWPMWLWISLFGILFTLLKHTFHHLRMAVSGHRLDPLSLLEEGSQTPLINSNRPSSITSYGSTGEKSPRTPLSKSSVAEPLQDELMTVVTVNVKKNHQDIHEIPRTKAKEYSLVNYHEVFASQDPLSSDLDMLVGAT